MFYVGEVFVGVWEVMLGNCECWYYLGWRGLVNYIFYLCDLRGFLVEYDEFLLYFLWGVGVRLDLWGYYVFGRVGGFLFSVWDVFFR